ncbi:ABC transporter permease [Ideonella sp. 4Y16]|uniref:ABC transporter permease n=1 Tax=Ideonella alba TaxID=2824118 RepID=A0A941BFK4_9BURK|nr:FtsX-like permease family protein [Ideonella alba]MBQ0931142.1 ABC transporter permease [Ideonella alba]MBQ0944292.1 ABC transporter permease [Ideonella alba]
MPDSPVRLPVWRLALNQTLRDLRAGQLRLVLLAVLLAVAALSAVGFFADRLQAGLVRDAAALIGGDAVVSSDQPTPPSFAEQARAGGLAVSRSASFPSMARALPAQGGATRLVALKAVDAQYPLRGQLTLRRSADGPTELVAGRPEPGTVWIDESLAGALGVTVGDPLGLGDAELRITRLIVLEPDRGAGFLAFAPRAMIHLDDLPATGLVQPASRINHRLAVAGSAQQRDAAVAWSRWARAAIESGSLKGIRVESLESGRPEMRQTLDRAGKFLSLVALLSALLAAVAVAIAARGFAEAHLDDCAMLRVLGVSRRHIALAYTMQFAALALVAGGAGVLLGWVTHLAFLGLLGTLVPAELPPAGLWPALLGLGVGGVLLLGFGLPPVLQLAQVPPLRVMRRDVGGLRPASLGVLAGGTLAFAALLVAVARDPVLGLIAVGGFAAATLLFALLAWGAVKLLGWLVPEAGAPRALRLATRQLVARPAYAVLQVSSLAVGLMALVLLVLLRTDLVDSWRRATPPDAPDRFVINLQPDQVADFEAVLKNAGVGAHDLYPMIRGRLLTINGAPPGAAIEADERARRLVEREFNLSHAAALPGHNRVTAGAWTPEEADALSVEEGLAQTLGLKLGDRLRFDIAGIEREGRVTSLRKVEWGSMRANFFVMFPVSQLPELPATWMAAYRAPAERGFDNRLVQRFPNLTNVDVTASINQLQSVLAQVIGAIETLFAFTLAAGLAVLLAAVTATRESRAREYAVMRACGASSRLLAQVQRVELLGVGALAGLLATLAAMGVGALLARYAFEFRWTAGPEVPLIGTAVGALLALAAGWWGLREVLRRPVVETLRRAPE